MDHDPPYTCWEHAIRNDADYAAHMDYVHSNPVKHGYATAPGEWPYSTFPACVARGLYPEAWVGTDVGDLEAGEKEITADLRRKKLALIEGTHPRWADRYPKIV